MKRKFGFFWNQLGSTDLAVMLEKLIVVVGGLQSKVHSRKNYQLGNTLPETGSVSEGRRHVLNPQAVNG